METRALHLATEELAAVLSEVAAGDLTRPTPCESWDVGDLCRHVLEENVRFGLAVTDDVAGTPSRPGLDLSPDLGRDLGRDLDRDLDRRYRRTAAFMERTFASVTDVGRRREVAGVPGPRTVLDLYEMQLCDTVVHTWDLAQAIGVGLDVDPDVAQTVVRRLEQVPDSARGVGKAFGPVLAPRHPGRGAVERIVLLSGRSG